MKNILLITLTTLIFHTNPTTAQTTKKAEETTIKRYLENWKKEKIQVGECLSDKNCNWDYIKKNNINPLAIYGMPKEIPLLLGDINGDGLEDGIALIHPNQCDGGNGSMNFQLAVLIVSTPQDYYILEKYPSLNLGLGGSFYHIHNLHQDKIQATYFEYSKTDSRCCPSIKKEVSLDFKNNFLYLNGQKVDLE